jgi:CelD/BcsL family acetyltransferase involved in cellulose biosynthesis
MREAGRAVGFLPARTGTFTALPVGAPFSDYQAVICEPGLDFDPLAIIRALGVHRYDFTSLLANQEPMARYGRDTNETRLVDLPDGYAAYEAEQKANGAKIFKRLGTSRRNAERNFGPLRFTAMSPSAETLEQLIAMKSAQLRETGKSDIFGPRWSHRLIHDLWRSEVPGFGACLFTLHAGDELAAMHLHLRNGRVLSGWLIAHIEKFQSFSPGVLLFQEILQWMETVGLTRLDLGVGDYQFKRAFANITQGIVSGSVGVPSPVTWMRQAAYGAASITEALPLGKFSHYPARARRRLDVIRSLR